MTAARTAFTVGGGPAGGFSVFRIFGLRIFGLAPSASVALLALGASAEAAVIHGMPSVDVAFGQAWYGETPFDGESAPLDVISVMLAPVQPPSVTISKVGQVQANADFDGFRIEHDGGFWAGQSGSFDLRTLGPGTASVEMSWEGQVTLTNTATETVSLFGQAGYDINGGITDFGPDESGRTEWTIGIRQLFPDIPGSEFGEFGREMVFGELCATEPDACGVEGPYDFNIFQLAATLEPGQSISYDLVMDFDLWLSKSVTMGEVPEPATLALLGLGLTGAAGFSRRRPA